MPDDPYMNFQRSLGMLISQFAEIEAILQLTLWHYAGVNSKIGAALFSGTRIDGAGSLIRRLMDVVGPTKKQREDVDDVLAQLAIVNGVRNQIVHHGAQGFANEDVGLITNRMIAIDAARLVEIPISTAIMNDLLADLQKIKTHLMLRHLAAGAVSAQALDAFGPVLSSPWRYKPPQPKRERRAQKESSRGRQK